MFCPSWLRMIGTSPPLSRVEAIRRNLICSLLFCQPAKGLNQFADQGRGGDEAHKKNASLEVYAQIVGLPSAPQLSSVRTDDIRS
jgi:hypothetical protein